MLGARGSGCDLGNSLWRPRSNNEVARRRGDRNKLQRLIMAGINYSILELSRVQGARERDTGLFLQRDVFKDAGRIYASLRNILRIVPTIVKMNIFKNNSKDGQNFNLLDYYFIWACTTLLMILIINDK